MKRTEHRSLRGVMEDNACAYNKFLTEDYLNKLRLSELLGLTHPLDRPIFSNKVYIKTMNKIQEYRKASAEALEIDPIEHHWLKGWVILVKIKGHRIEWHPDIDANQMLKVWEWLMKQGCFLNIDNWDINSPYRVTFATENGLKKGGHESVLIATMKAFMEFIKTK